MHVRPEAFKLTPLLSQLIAPGGAKARQSAEPEGKSATPEQEQASAADEVAVPETDQASTPAWPRGRWAHSADSEKSTAKQDKLMRPEPPVGRLLEPKLLGALIHSQKLTEVGEGLVARLDGDGDSALSLQEFRDGLPGGRAEAPPQAERVEAAFARFDADGDGKATASEITAALLPWPEGAMPTETPATSQVIDVTRA